MCHHSDTVAGRKTALRRKYIEVKKLILKESNKEREIRTSFADVARELSGTVTREIYTSVLQASSTVCARH